MKIFLLLLLTLNISALGHAQKTETSTRLLKVFQDTEVSIENLSIELIEVLEDSRCPKGVDCIWAGQAKVLVAITEDRGKTEQKEITINGFNPFVAIFQKDSLNIFLNGLSPYPVPDHKTKPEEYFLTLTVESLQN